MAKASNTKKKSPSSAAKEKKHKGRNYFAGVGANNGTKPNVKKQKTNEKSKKERLEYAEGEKWSKAKKKRMRKLLAKGRLGIIDGDDDNMNSTHAETGSSAHKKQKKGSEETKKEKKAITNKDIQEKNQNPLFAGTAVPGKMSDLQKSFLDRLSGSRFRILNEELYTKPSQESLERFQKNPELFEQYHEGFRTQVLQWPVNPVDIILEWILKYIQRRSKQKKKQNKKAKKYETNKSTKAEDGVVIADFGCGDAKLAKEIISSMSDDSGESEGENKSKKEQKKKKKDTVVKVHSFDLVSGGNPLITACDMTDVPLQDKSVDVAVFSLALMGTNVADFIREAHRVMCPDGILKIAEVRSRFESTNATSSTDDKTEKKGRQNNLDGSKNVDLSNLSEFVDVMRELGFNCKNMDRSNQMFVMFDFEKNGREPNKGVQFSLRPCIYKRR